MRMTTPVVARPRFPAWLLAVSLALATIAIYWPATRCGFVNYDDDMYVTDNAHVISGVTWESLKWACLNPVSANWHPLTILSHMLDCQIFGLKPWGHHLTSLLLHALNAALVFVLLRQMTALVMWRARDRVGLSMATSSTMIATTISSSISVKPTRMQPNRDGTRFLFKQ